jgi:F-box-like
VLPIHIPSLVANIALLSSILSVIDDKIRDHSEAIICLKRERNSNVPISRLPPEILSAIFFYNVLDGGHDFSYRFISASLGGWISVTYVCHYWREIALQSASLWSHWGVPDARWTDIFFSRSRQAPLYIRTSFSSRLDLATFLELLRKSNCLDRTRELHLQGPGACLTEVLEIFNHRPTSDDLINSIPESSMQSIIIHPTFSTVLQLPAPFLSHRFPHLWQLKLVDCTFDWDSAIFESAHLTHLTISMLPSSAHTTVSRILSILAQQPLLEEFSFRYTDPLSSSDEPGASPINLPRLRSVELEGLAQSCFRLITGLSYRRKQVNISLIVSVDVDDLTTYVVPFVSKHYGDDVKGDDPTPTIEELSIRTSFSPQMSCMAPLEPSDQSGVPAPSFLLRIKQNFWVMSGDIMMAPVYTALPLRAVRKAIFDCPNLGPIEWGLNVFATMDNLEELELNGVCTESAVVALMPEKNKNPVGGDSAIDKESHTDLGVIKDEQNLSVQRKTPLHAGPAQDYDEGSTASEQFIHPIPVPKLNTLRLVNANFSASYGHSFADDLASCLEARQDACSKLSTLSFASCRCIDNDEIAIYEDLVGNIEWDNVVGFHDIGSSDCSSQQEDHYDYDYDYDHEYDYDDGNYDEPPFWFF